MPPLNDPEGQPYGPKLNGFVKDTATETRARETIRNGTPRMPGFQYGLEQEQIDAKIGRASCRERVYVLV